MSETPLQLKAEGLANLRETLKEHEGKRIILMFFGSILEEGDHIGESWCPDCRDVEPVMETALQKASSDVIFVLVIVGNKSEWKDPNNEFRTSEFKVTEIPTLVEYGTDKRLGCEDCKVQDKVNQFLQK